MFLLNKFLKVFYTPLIPNYSVLFNIFTILLSFQSLLTHFLLPLVPDRAISVYNPEKHNTTQTEKARQVLERVFIHLFLLFSHVLTYPHLPVEWNMSRSAASSNFRIIDAVINQNYLAMSSKKS